MFFPLSRGNIIEWKINGIVITIHDHSYNSGAQSLLNMLDNHDKNAIFIFTPLRECHGTQAIYEAIAQKTPGHRCWVFDPHHELTNFPWNNFQDKAPLMGKIIDWIQQQNQDGHIYIKGANSFKMITLVEDVLQWLGNNTHTPW